MSQSFIVAKRIYITPQKFHLEIGDIVTFKPENANSFTVYRGGSILKTFNYTQVGVDALKSGGTLVSPEAKVPHSEPIEPTPVEPSPEAKGEKGASEGGTDDTLDPEITKEPKPVDTPEGTPDDVEVSQENPEDYTTFTKKDLIAYAEKHGYTIDATKGRGVILASVMEAVTKAKTEPSVGAGPTDATV